MGEHRVLGVPVTCGRGGGKAVNVCAKRAVRSPCTVLSSAGNSPGAPLCLVAAADQESFRRRKEKREVGFRESCKGNLIICLKHAIKIDGGSNYGEISRVLHRRLRRSTCGALA